MTEYERGQRDLINHIKIRVTKILDTQEGTDLLFDITYLLKTLKPINLGDKT